jgi:hypothetical protein
MLSVLKKDVRRNRSIYQDGPVGIYRRIKSAATQKVETNFGALLMVVSVSLISCVGGYIVLKLTYGIDLPFVAMKFAGQIDKLGQFGDFFGGVLNPLLSFMALLGVLYTIRTQGQELKEAREETRIANRIQDKQTAVFERQNFESVFFRLIDVHARTAERIRDNTGSFGANGFQAAVREVLLQYRYACEDSAQAQRKTPKPQYAAIKPEISSDQQLLLQAFEEGVEGEIRVLLSQYYRNMYQILKLVDGFKMFSGDQQTGRRSPRMIRMEYFHRRQYSNILRAQLSDDELKLMFFNCITPYGAGLKAYVEQYSLLKHLQVSKFLNGNKALFDLYEDTAYADYEDIGNDKIIGFAGARVRNQIRAMYKLNKNSDELLRDK